MKGGGLISRGGAWRGLPTSDSSSSLSRDRANVSAREQISRFCSFTPLLGHLTPVETQMSECTRTPRTSTSVLMQPGLHAVAPGFGRLVLVKVELRGGFESLVGFVAGEIGSCDVLREHAHVCLRRLGVPR